MGWGQKAETQGACAPPAMPCPARMVPTPFPVHSSPPLAHPAPSPLIGKGPHVPPALNPHLSSPRAFRSCAPATPRTAGGAGAYIRREPFPPWGPTQARRQPLPDGSCPALPLHRFRLCALPRPHLQGSVAKRRLATARRKDGSATGVGGGVRQKVPEYNSGTEQPKDG